MLTLHFAESVAIDFAPLVAAFGEPEQRPRAHPEDPVPWRFEVPGGWLMLETGAAEESARKVVSSVRIRRRY